VVVVGSDVAVSVGVMGVGISMIDFPQERIINNNENHE
jgi:hypothetical protein